ncbi:MAG: DNA/RNA non-specific endonuclease [Bacteroidia bacterium]|nr:DNA/RNA non-specific endonuclease [Bacteroidia bacterium]
MRNILAVWGLLLSLAACTPDNPDPNSKSSRDNNLETGNPSGAEASAASPDNFLIVRDQYAMSYNSDRGTANWVSWHLSTAWRGDAERQNNFRVDTDLPGDFFAAATSHYTGSGFDRGHLCPSEDRDRTEEDNSATFLMTNIIPQAPNNNQGVWKKLEEYCRDLSDAGYEMYIIAGPAGKGGYGSNGGSTSSLNGGTIAVPSHVWKIILILTNGKRDLDRVDGDTRLIAVKIPNRESVGDDWGNYRVSVDDLEDLTGFDFLSALSNGIEEELEERVDDGPTE